MPPGWNPPGWSGSGGMSGPPPSAGPGWGDHSPQGFPSPSPYAPPPGGPPALPPYPGSSGPPSGSYGPVTEPAFPGPSHKPPGPALPPPGGMFSTAPAPDLWPARGDSSGPDFRPPGWQPGITVDISVSRGPPGSMPPSSPRSPIGGYNSSSPSQPPADSKPAYTGSYRPPGPGNPRPPGPNSLRPPGPGPGSGGNFGIAPGDKQGSNQLALGNGADFANISDKELIQLALENRFGNRLRGASEETSNEVESLRKQVQDLMKKNEELSKENEQKRGSKETEGARQAKDELHSVLDALRRRVSCMDAKFDHKMVPQPRRTTMRRASSAESLFYAAGLLEAPPGGKKMVMDLTDMRSHETSQSGGEPESSSGWGAQRRSLSGDPGRGRDVRDTAFSTASTCVFDLTSCRQTIKPGD